MPAGRMPHSSAWGSTRALADPDPCSLRTWNRARPPAGGTVPAMLLSYPVVHSSLHPPFPIPEAPPPPRGARGFPSGTSLRELTAVQNLAWGLGTVDRPGGSAAHSRGDPERPGESRPWAPSGPPPPPPENRGSQQSTRTQHKTAAEASGPGSAGCTMVAAPQEMPKCPSEDRGWTLGTRSAGNAMPQHPKVAPGLKCGFPWELTSGGLDDKQAQGADRCKENNS